MKIKLLEDVHKEWCPKGTVGRLEFEEGIISKFYPDNPPFGCPWKDGIYIGGIKYEEA